MAGIHLVQCQSICADTVRKAPQEPSYAFQTRISARRFLRRMSAIVFDPRNSVQLSLQFDQVLALLTPDEIYAQADEALLRAIHEDRRIERKPPMFHRTELGEYVCMWANTPPDGGIIVVGMADKGTVIGCHELSPKDLNSLEKVGHSFCPEARYESRRVFARTPAGEPTFLVVFRVYYRHGRVAYHVNGNAYNRIGDSIHKLTSDEIQELRIDKGERDYETEPVGLVYPDDFDMALVRRFVDNFRQIRDAPDLSTTQVLELRRLGCTEDNRFRPNIACCLLFAQDPGQLFAGCKVRFLRYQGEHEGTGEQYNVVKDEFIEGPIPTLISRTAELLRAHLRDFSRLGKDGHFYTVPEYPREAWFEALVNACVHRSYGFKNMAVVVKMFDDRLVVESPGGFPPFVTPENIYNAGSQPRNPRLMNALYYLQLTREHNEGTRRMRKSMAEMALPEPAFEQLSGAGNYGRVVVTLRNNQNQRKQWVDADVATLLGEAQLKNLSTQERQVLNFLAINGWIRPTQCQEQTGIRRWHTARDLLLGMVDKGILAYHRTKPAGKKDNNACFTIKGQPPPLRLG